MPICVASLIMHSHLTSKKNYSASLASPYTIFSQVDIEYEHSFPSILPIQSATDASKNRNQLPLLLFLPAATLPTQMLSLSPSH